MTCTASTVARTGEPERFRVSPSMYASLRALPPARSIGSLLHRRRTVSNIHIRMRMQSVVNVANNKNSANETGDESAPTTNLKPA